MANVAHIETLPDRNGEVVEFAVVTIAPTDYALAALANRSGWVLDSGTTSHMTLYATDLKEVQEGITSVQLCDGSVTQATHRGKATIRKNIILNNCLLVPKLSYRLISVTKLQRDDYKLCFNSNLTCRISKFGVEIASAKANNKIYFIESYLKIETNGNHHRIYSLKSRR
jgi:hypothetical protein